MKSRRAQSAYIYADAETDKWFRVAPDRLSYALAGDASRPVRDCMPTGSRDGPFDALFPGDRLSYHFHRS
jgi:hypothetical protein